MTFRFAWELTEIRRKLINHLLNYFLVSHLVILQTCVLFNSNCELKPTINQNSPKLVTLLYIFCHPLARRLLRTGACSPVSRRGILVVQRHTRRPRKTRRRPAFYMALARGAKRPLLLARSLARSLVRTHARSYVENRARNIRLARVDLFVLSRNYSLRHKFSWSIWKEFFLDKKSCPRAEVEDNELFLAN